MGRGLLLVALLLAGLVRFAHAEPEDWLERNTLGFEIADLDRGQADRLDSGTAVAFVYPGVPLSGVDRGCLIVSLEGRRIESRRDWEAALSALPIGREARLAFRPFPGLGDSGAEEERLRIVHLRVMTGREAAQAAVRVSPDPVTGVPVARLAESTEFVDDSDAPLRLRFAIEAEGGIVPYLQLSRGWTAPLQSIVLSEQGRDLAGPFDYEVRVTPRLPEASAGLSEEGLVDVDETTLALLGRVLQFASPPPPPFPQPRRPVKDVSLRVSDGAGVTKYAITPRQAAAFRAVLRAYHACGGTLPATAPEAPGPATITRPPPRFPPPDPLPHRPVPLSSARSRPK